MKDTLSTVTVIILGKAYQVSCPTNEVDELTRAARFLDERMDEIRSSGRVVGLDRVAVMAALNVTNDYLSGQSTLDQTGSLISERIDHLTHKISRTLAEHKQAE